MSAAPGDYAVLRSESVYEGAVVSLRRDTVRMSDGTQAVREVVDHQGAVGVVALDAEGNIVMVNQYRHPVRQRLDELPAGLLDIPREPALTAAQRELAEEASLIADEWHVLLDLLPSPGMSSEAIRLYLARGLRDVPVADRFAPEHEELTLSVSRVPLEDALARVLAGEITNAAAVAGVLAAVIGHRSGWAGLRPADAPWPARPGR